MCGRGLGVFFWGGTAAARGIAPASIPGGRGEPLVRWWLLGELGSGGSWCFLDHAGPLPLPLVSGVGEGAVVAESSVCEAASVGNGGGVVAAGQS